jgi:hypothetical protein
VSDRYAAIREHRGRFPVRLMCAALGVSVGGFYAAEARRTAPPSPRAADDERLRVKVRVAHTKSRRRYGAPRVHRELAAGGERVSRKRVARLMREDGLAARRRRKFIRTTDSNHPEPVAPNLLARRFAVSEHPEPDCVWVSDITYLPTREGWLFLAVVLDLATRRVVGWAMRETLETELALAALRMALADRRPARAAAPLGQGIAIRERRLPGRARRARRRAEHEPPRGLPGQRGGRELLRHVGARAARRGRLRLARRGAASDLRVHRGVVQRGAAALEPRLRQPRAVRAATRPVSASGLNPASVPAGQVQSGTLYGISDPLEPGRRVAPPHTDRRLSARLTTSLELMALGMHYGFPTASLDVTPDDTVALWFALNVARPGADGRIRYEPTPGLLGAAEGPSVYVYIQRHTGENPVVDLTAGALTRERASRPFVQRAWALPFYRHALHWMGDMDAQFYTISGPAQRWPSAVIKPVFGPQEAARARAAHDVGELFPPDDLLYRALLGADVPRLARYAT